MKGKLLVIFSSAHGYAKRYVDILGNALGCDAVPADKFKPDMLSGYDKLVYIAGIHAGSLMGFKKVAEYLDMMYDKLAVCGVGMFPYKKGIAESVRESSVSVTYEKFIPVFYAQGGFDMSELSRTEKLSINMTVRQIKSNSIISESDSFFINATAEPVDEVKQANIQPLIDYLDGKTVDEELYAPAEITDPEEIKKFFEEQEAAMAAPVNKKRELKKKLKR